MNPVEKPKRLKLWKNSGIPGKKQLQKTMKPTVDCTPEKTMKKKRKKNKFQKDMKMGIADDSNSECAGKKLSLLNSKSIKIKTEKSEEMDGSQTQGTYKRKNEFPESSPSKKMKGNNKAKKEWKMLHLNDKKKSAKDSKSEKSDSEVKPELMTKKERKRKKMEKKGKLENFELAQKLKALWENFRRGDCQVEDKKKLMKQTLEIVKGRVKEFTFAHDTVRVLECVVAEGSDADRALLFKEIQSDIISLAKSKYGKFLLLKMLRYGSKEQKNTIMKEFHGKIVHLIRHTEAAEVVELAFNECANTTQRFEFVQEFYGPTYRYFKTTDCHTLNELFGKEPDKKATVIQHLKEELLKVLEKSVVKHSIVHHLLWQFMQYADDASKAEVIESLRAAVPEILHTKDGSRVAMHCIWFGTVKDRKIIVKSMKTFVSKIAMEEHGHMVLLALFDCFDDIRLLRKHIISELAKNLLEISQNIHGRKVLIYLLNPRDSHYIHPDVLNILKTGDINSTSKKDTDTRQNELKAVIAQPLLDLIKENIQNLYRDNSFCLFTSVILKNIVGNKEKAYESIAHLAVEPYTTENKNVHVIEHSGSTFMLKQLIIQDKYDTQSDCTFSETLVKNVPERVFSSWVECNRGAFLLVSLLETQLPSVVQRIKEDLEGFNKYLSKKCYKGAEILLKKLKG